MIIAATAYDRDRDRGDDHRNQSRLLGRLNQCKAPVGVMLGPPWFIADHESIMRVFPANVCHQPRRAPRRWRARAADRRARRALRSMESLVRLAYDAVVTLVAETSPLRRSRGPARKAAFEWRSGGFGMAFFLHRANELTTTTTARRTSLTRSTRVSACTCGCSDRRRVLRVEKIVPTSFGRWLVERPYQRRSVRFCGSRPR